MATFEFENLEQIDAALAREPRPLWQVYDVVYNLVDRVISDIQKAEQQSANAVLDLHLRRLVTTVRQRLPAPSARRSDLLDLGGEEDWWVGLEEDDGFDDELGEDLASGLGAVFNSSETEPSTEKVRLEMPRASPSAIPTRAFDTVPSTAREAEEPAESQPKEVDLSAPVSAITESILGRITDCLAGIEERRSSGEAEGLRDLVANDLARRVLDVLIDDCPSLIITKISDALMATGQFYDVSLINRGGMGWVFSARQNNGRRVAIKVPQNFVAPEVAELYEREMMFLRTIYENDLDEEGWFTRFLGEGVLRIGTQDYHYVVLAYYEGPPRRMRFDKREIETDQALTLEEALDIFPKLPPILGALLVENMLQALRSMQQLGFIHGDLKPGNYLLAREVAMAIDDVARRLDSLDDADFIDLHKAVAEAPVRVITADFGGIREMSLFFLGDDVVDKETGREIVVRTPAYANHTGILQSGSKAHSDRHAVASILFELLSGQMAHDSKQARRYWLPFREAGHDPEYLELMDIALEVLNDPREDAPHCDSQVEVRVTEEFLRKIRRYIKKYEGSYKVGFMQGVAKKATRAFRRMNILGRPRPRPEDKKGD